jgi:hypothetical protein
MAIIFCIAFFLIPRPSLAQRQDTAKVGKLDRITECLPVRQDTLPAVQVPSVILGPVTPKTGPPPCKVPISPGSAFLRSFLIPGFAQLKLDRSRAAAIFIAAEVGTVGMSLKSWNDLRKAKDARKDTVLTAVLDDEGNPVIDSVTNEPQFTSAPRNPNLVGRIRARRTHLEDWIAAAIFNHLFAGADAYVAAHLADFDTNVKATYVPGELRVMARIAW